MKKIENSPFDPFVKWFFPKLLPGVPGWMSANVISLAGLVGSALVLPCLWLTWWSRWMCLAGAFFVFVHWFTDTLDGVVARARRTSQLGFYLDHFGDSLAVVFIGLGMFLVKGSHMAIGLVAVVLYLLLIVNGLLKAELTRVMELPAFGPTEIHLSIILVLVTQAFVDFGQPLSWLPGITADDGWLTRALGFESGLTFIDLCGVLVIAAAGVMLMVESVRTALVARQLDRQDDITG